MRSRPRAEPSAQGRAGAANSKTLMSSIAQTTIGTVPPVTTTSTTRQAATTHTTNSAAAAGSQPSTQAGSADATLTAAQPAVQMAPWSPYATPLPTPGFPFLPTGCPPYWGMYPYPYPQYVPPMPTLSLGGNLAAMNAITSAPRTEQCPPPAPVPDLLETGPEPSPSPGEVLGLPADIYDDMPRLEGQEDSDEGSEIKMQGASNVHSGPSPERERMSLRMSSVPSQVQSPSSRGHHGVAEQVFPIAPRTLIKTYEENGDEGTSRLPNKGSDAAGPSGLGTDFRPVTPVPLWVVTEAKRKQRSHHHLRKDREHAL